MEFGCMFVRPFDGLSNVLVDAVDFDLGVFAVVRYHHDIAQFTQGVC